MSGCASTSCSSSVVRIDEIQHAEKLYFHQKRKEGWKHCIHPSVKCPSGHASNNYVHLSCTDRSGVFAGESLIQTLSKHQHSFQRQVSCSQEENEKKSLLVKM